MKSNKEDHLTLLSFIWLRKSLFVVSGCDLNMQKNILVNVTDKSSKNFTVEVWQAFQNTVFDSRICRDLMKQRCLLIQKWKMVIAISLKYGRLNVVSNNVSYFSGRAFEIKWTTLNKALPPPWWYGIYNKCNIFLSVKQRIFIDFYPDLTTWLESHL